MTYTFEKHLHNYACWTAARAVQRNFTNTSNIIRAIEASDLMKFDSLKVNRCEDYDAFHRICCNQLIDNFKKDCNIVATYGRVAKIVAIYLKTAIIIRYSGEGKLVDVIHPPIDRILLTNLRKNFKEVIPDKINWTELDENNYFDLIAKLRTLPFEKFWQLEEFWSAADEETHSVLTTKIF
nr:hypothetical protein [uncultured Bacteroides sp.]